jgi:peptide/nickel transport system permease protein
VRQLAVRLITAPFVLLALAALTYSIPRWAHPERYPGVSVWAGVRHDLDRAFLHLDFGRACGWPGCPPIHDMWLRGAAMDLWLLGGAMAIGIGGGVLGGLWCAARPRSRLARVAEGASVVAFCTPVYVMGLGLLLLFNPTFGRFPLPGFFDATARWASPFSDPVAWLRTLLVPWLVLAAPLGAMCLRLTLGMTIDALDEHYTRTAVAKGLSHRQVVNRHAGRAAAPAITTFASVSVPLLVLNVVLVERALSVPGFFTYTWRATGHPPNPNDYPPLPDYQMTAALMLWAAALTIVVSLVLDLVAVRLDPRIRASGSGSRTGRAQARPA